MTIAAQPKPTRHGRWLGLLLVVFALVSLTVGAIAKQHHPGIYPSTWYRLFFSDSLHLKVWFATAAMALAIVQLATAARIYQVLRLPPQGRFYTILHRWSGRTAILLTLPVAYHCIFLLGYGTYTTRVEIHSLLGSIVYGAIVCKILVVRRGSRFPAWTLPLLGGTVFAIILGLWLTSALWFFTNIGISR
jgi:Family of unknown function (DUF6529)